MAKPVVHDKPVICSSCNGEGCKFCNNTGEVIIREREL